MVDPCPECGSKTVECLEFCDCGWCADGVLRPQLCVDYGHHGRERCVVCGIPNPRYSDGRDRG